MIQFALRKFTAPHGRNGSFSTGATDNAYRSMSASPRLRPILHCAATSREVPLTTKVRFSKCNVRLLDRPFDPGVNLATERSKVDGFGEQALGTVLQRLALGLGVTVGGDHDHRDIRSGRLGLGQQF